jgi:Ca-activated chloride channel family protein
MMLLLLLQMLAQAAQGGPAFKSSSELVVLHVSVVDRHAGFVSGLPRDGFTVYEDGRPQPIAFFENEDTPVTVGLVIDSSGSMLPRRDAVITAGMAFAESSRPDDEMFTIAFNERIWRGLPDGQTFTSDHQELHRALDRSGARGKTALFDAIDAGLEQLDNGGKTRKVLIVISDGGDNASRLRYQEVLDAALRRDVVIYTVGIYDSNDTDADPGLMRELAASTGGEAFFPKALDEVEPALQRIARDIRSSYTIGFVPPAAVAAGRPRKIKVELRLPDGRKPAVRARSAYMSGGIEARGGGK